MLLSVCVSDTMLLTNITDSLTAGVPLSVDFSHPVDYLIFIFQILFATTVVFVAGPIVITIFATKELRRQNRFIFMLNTSICDTLIGFSVYYVGLFDVQEGYPSRNGTYNMLNYLLGVNLITFLFAQFDRYIGFLSSFHLLSLHYEGRGDFCKHLLLALCLFSGGYFDFLALFQSNTAVRVWYPNLSNHSVHQSGHDY